MAHVIHVRYVYDIFMVVGKYTIVPWIVWEIAHIIFVWDGCSIMDRPFLKKPMIHALELFQSETSQALFDLIMAIPCDTGGAI